MEQVRQVVAQRGLAVTVAHGNAQRQRQLGQSERLRQLAAQRFGLGELPVVELGAVAQGETGQEVGAVERLGFRQRGQARGGMSAAGWPCVRQAASRARNSVTSTQRSALEIKLTVSRSTARWASPRAVRSVESVRRRAARACWSSYSGQSSAASVSRAWPRPVTATIGQQRDRLARVHGDRYTVARDARRAQEVDGEMRHGVSLCSKVAPCHSGIEALAGHVRNVRNRLKARFRL